MQNMIYCQQFSICFAIIIGAIFGSFSTFLGYRLFNEDKSLKLTCSRSICCNCKHKLLLLDLVPILSFLCLRGKCRFCKERIPIWHFLAEIIMVISSVLAVKHFNGINSNSILMCLLCFCLLTQSIIDYRVMMSSDFLHLIEFLVVFFLSRNLGFEIRYFVKCCLATFLLFLFISILMKKIFKKNCLGFGDIKLFIILTPLFTIEKIPLFFGLCGAIGIIFYFLINFFQEKDETFFIKLKNFLQKKSEIFPFIPSIFVAFLLAFYL